MATFHIASCSYFNISWARNYRLTGTQGNYIVSPAEGVAYNHETIHKARGYIPINCTTIIYYNRY
jgi:hypothetical protein